MNPFDLSGKKFVVTGASSGIGRQCCISCSQMNAQIILIGRDTKRLQETKSQMVNPDYHAMYSVDINDTEILEQTVNEIKDKIGSVDGIIHCAGISTTLPIKLVTNTKMEEFFKTNVFSAFHLTKLLLKPGGFNKIGGSIIFMSSVMSVVGESGKSLYSMTKGALLSGARSLAIELSRKKIRVNCISPGVVISPMSANAIYSQDPEMLERVTNMHPLGLGNVTDVANGCVYLLSDASKWVTGTNLVIDGGYVAK
ncbi:MAG: SDR family oxidoreductase [Salinivirgaceae bacterium]|nr:SDR family oxidoreductase [Salinivirgaceae bacterium]